MIAEAPEWVQALVLGIVQGLTEFIPVSSSGHLVLVPALAGWPRHGLAFDVALHVGTLAALLLYYRRDLWAMLRAVTVAAPSPERDGYRRLIGLLALASVPVAVAGLTLDGLVESVFDDPITTAWLLFATAGVLLAGEWVHRRREAAGTVTADDLDAPSVAGGPEPLGGLQRLTVGQALTVGVAQCFALLPGLSRSGLTISSGIAAGLSRPSATRFAFLLGLPAIGGAALVQLPAVDDLGTLSVADLVVGVVASAVSGYLAIAFLVRLVSRAGVEGFAYYVLPVAVLSLLVLGAG
ncbi:MAG: undecaprenyl-diphosphate phosphatase [Nitriliruptoraceae bacterium]